jgi:hypothetical protein
MPASSQREQRGAARGVVLELAFVDEADRRDAVRAQAPEQFARDRDAVGDRLGQPEYRQVVERQRDGAAAGGRGEQDQQGGDHDAARH